GTVQQAEPVFPGFHIQKGPYFSVHQICVAKKLRNDGGVWNPAGGGLRPSRIKKRTVPVEGPVLNDQGNVKFAPGKIEGQLLAVADQIKSRQPGIYVEPGDA